MGKSNADDLILTEEIIESFLLWQTEKGKADITIDRYRTDLNQLMDWLPDEKMITIKQLERWRKEMLLKGYAGRTINSKLSAINSFLAYAGRRELQILEFEVNQPIETTLSREEYLQMLQAAKKKKNNRLYLLIKVFGDTGLPVLYLKNLTMEAVREGSIVIDDVKYLIPDRLRCELLAYGDEQGREDGPLFLTRSGHPMNRTTVTCLMKRLSKATGIAEEKLSPRCLKKMYQNTQSELQHNVEHLVIQAHEQLLEEEQKQIEQAL